jgi:succinoglycan biosynthesis protein ExoA
LYSQYFKYGVGRSRTVRRHPSSLRLRQLAVPAHLALTVFAIAVSPFTRIFLCWPALYALTVVGFALALALRQRSFTGLLAAPAAFTMHTAWASGFFCGLLSHRERVWQPHATAPLVIAAGGRR